jgi:rhomboid family GlyGly-CTERM serine protease
MGLHQASDGAVQSVLRRSTAWRVPLSLAVFSALAASGGSAAQLQLRYDRTGIAEGELWRFVTGHFVHLGMTHLILNIAGLAVVWLLVGGGYSLFNWVFVIAFSLAVIDLCFWLLDPGLSWYVGMSGLLHSLLVAGIVSRFRVAKGESLALAAVIAVKIAWEQLAGPLPGSELSAGGAVVVNAHLYGVVAGVLAAGVLRVITLRRVSI